jgi:hypothetical protein
METAADSGFLIGSAEHLLAVLHLHVKLISSQAGAIE